MRVIEPRMNKPKFLFENLKRRFEALVSCSDKNGKKAMALLYLTIFRTFEAMVKRRNNNTMVFLN